MHSQPQPSKGTAACVITDVANGFATTLSYAGLPFATGAGLFERPMVNVQPTNGWQCSPCGDRFSVAGSIAAFEFAYGESGPRFSRLCMRLSRTSLANTSW
jgi:hypothetical protein